MGFRDVQNGFDLKLSIQFGKLNQSIAFNHTVELDQLNLDSSKVVDSVWKKSHVYGQNKLEVTFQLRKLI